MKRLVVTTLTVIATLSLALSQKVNYEVYALRYASVSTPFPISSLVLDGPDKESINAVFMVWLVKGDNGKNILIDAGFIADIEESKNHSLKNYERPDSILSKVGVRAEEISDIILTHPIGITWMELICFRMHRSGFKKMILTISLALLGKKMQITEASIKEM